MAGVSLALTDPYRGAAEEAYRQFAERLPEVWKTAINLEEKSLKKGEV
tara:strand:- start:267 stop:410 length:144 start_codon:yes stop_codon:yes gene_type:complete